MAVRMACNAVGGTTAVAGAVAGDGCVGRRHAAFTVAVASAKLRTTIGRALCVASRWTCHEYISILLLLLLLRRRLEVAVSLLEDRLVDERAVAMNLDPSTVDLHASNSSESLRHDCLRLIDWLIDWTAIIDEPRISRLRQLGKSVFHLDRTIVHNRQIATILQNLSMVDNILRRLHNRLLASNKERERLLIRSNRRESNREFRIVKFDSTGGVRSDGALANVDISRPPNTLSRLGIWVIPALGLVELCIKCEHEGLSTTVHHLLDITTLSIFIHGEEHQCDVCLQIQR